MNQNITEEYDIIIDNFEQLVAKYRPLILRCIKKAFSEVNEARYMIEFDDMYQLCLIAIFKAIQAYDKEKCPSFPGFLNICVMNELRTFNRDFRPGIYEKQEGVKYKNGAQRFRKQHITFCTMTDYVEWNKFNKKSGPLKSVDDLT